MMSRALFPIINVLATAVVLITGLVSRAIAYESLQEAYDNAGRNGLYDKYVELDPDVEYMGDLVIDDSLKVRIDGNGALIFGIDDQVAVNIHFAEVDISHCVVIGGSCGIFFGAESSGNVFCNTVTGSSYYGIEVVYPFLQRGIEVWDNIITNCYYGFYCVENYHPRYLGYNTVYSTESFRYAELCPG